LKHRHGDRPGFEVRDEYDVQDVLHAIIRGLFDDVRSEEYTPSYAGGSSRMDFLLKSEQIVIEVKLASATLRDKQIGEQLLIDIGRYQSYQDCRRLICFVYDPMGYVKKPLGTGNRPEQNNWRLCSESNNCFCLAGAKIS
jgi:DpnII restriction endonuclease